MKLKSKRSVAGCLSATLVLAWTGQPSAGNAVGDPPAIELVLSARSETVVQHGQVGLVLKLRNTSAEGVPFSPEIAGRPQGGARVWLEVATRTEGAESERNEFLPEPTLNSGDSVPMAMLAPRGEAVLEFEVGARLRSVEGQPSLVFAFPRAGAYSVTAFYRWKDCVSASNALSVVCEAASAETLVVLERVQALKERAYWIYEPQMIPPAARLEELSDLASLAAGDSVFSDYARFALAWHFGEQSALARVDPERFGTSAGIAREFLNGLRDSGFPFDGKLKLLRQRLAPPQER